MARTTLINVSNGKGPPVEGIEAPLILTEVTDTDEEITYTDNTSGDFPETTDYDATTDSSVNVHPTRPRR